jgi:hypothetical protein
MVAGKNETVRSLLRKKFVPVDEGADHLFFAYMVDGEPVSKTCVSHGPDEDLTPFLLRIMGKQCHLTTKQFYDFAKCNMTEKQYRQILIDKGIISEEGSMAQ